MAKWQHKQRHKKFDYTAVADRPTATQLVWFTGLRAKLPHSPQQPCNQKDINLQIHGIFQQQFIVFEI